MAFTAEDRYLFAQGRHFRLYDKLGCHPARGGAKVAVWAPGARSVHVIGDGPGWDPPGAVLSCKDGIWSGKVKGLKPGARYKFKIETGDGLWLDKTDPFAFQLEVPPSSASVVTDLAYSWSDDEWLAGRKARSAPDAPISIYEVHLGSWQRPPDGRVPSYSEVAERLAAHVKGMGFTHVELLPLCEHPFYGSWGYQTTGYFAATSRYGHPVALMALIDALHAHDIGVILDWVPSHFATDDYGLARFDGTALFEHPDRRRGFHPDWGSYIFDYGRPQVRSFLISSALFWLDAFHVDALRVDAVASMLYLDYSRGPGEWLPNEHGGNQHYEAVHFLQELTGAVHQHAQGAVVIAEESTAWPGVCEPVEQGGLGFDYKWDMGWMHDSLAFLKEDPVHRRHHHDKLTFRQLYAWNERYVLPLSHDEVVHLKASLLHKMPGDDWAKFANLRLLLAAMFAQPGKKLLFMGAELAQRSEWNHDTQLQWELLQWASHAGVQALVAALNHLLVAEPALYALDTTPEGFAWLVVDDRGNSVVAFLRRDAAGRAVLFVANYTPVPRHGYTIGLPGPGTLRQLLNTDDEAFGGTGMGRLESLRTADEPCGEHPCSVQLLLPPLGAMFFSYEVG